MLPELNHTRWGIRLKLLGVAALIFAAWDLPGGLCGFRWAVAPFLSSEPSIGATGGTAWEWCVRARGLGGGEHRHRIFLAIISIFIQAAVTRGGQRCECH